MGRIAFLRARLTYGNVVATLALFVALGGASYAAMAVAPNSVGTAQLKDNAVISSKVKDASLLARDFAAGQLPKGPRGPRGLPGRDGAAVAVRPQSIGSVKTPLDGSAVSVPLSSNSWTQRPNEVDFGPFGRITYTPPDSSSCGGPAQVDLQIQLYVDGNFFTTAEVTVPNDGGTRTAIFNPTRYLFEPGSAVTHTVTAKAVGQCDSSAAPAQFTVSDVRFDLIRAS